MSDLKCRGCGSTTVLRFLDLGTSPLADQFPDSPAEARSQQVWPLRLGACHTCWLVQLVDLVPDELLFGEDYGFFSGSSVSLLDHFQEYAAWVMATFPEQCARGVVEVACNDGTLLAHFAASGYPTLGVDPAGPATAAARARGLDVLTEPFGNTVARRLDRRGGVVLANNVLAHVRSPGDVLAGVATLLGTDGVAVFEVQYLANLLVGNQFDHVYHEHRSFFSWSSLRVLLERYGLVGEVRMVDTQGGSLRVVARPQASVRRPYIDPLWESEAWLRRRSPYLAMQGHAEHVRGMLRELLHREQKVGRMIAGYAAAAKATTLMHYADLEDFVQFVVDTTPTKIGKYMPGTSVQIAGPDRDPPDTYVLFAHNYLPGVLRRERAFFDGGGRMVVPLPLPVVL